MKTLFLINSNIYANNNDKKYLKNNYKRIQNYFNSS